MTKRLTYLKSAKSIQIGISIIHDHEREGAGGMIQSKHTIPFRVTDDEKHLIQSYAASHHLIVSSFIRDLVLVQLEEDGELEEARFFESTGTFG